LYIFNREGVCLHYREWSRPKHVKDGAGTLVDDAKMMFGLLFSLKNICTAIDPTREVKRPLGAPTPHGAGCSFSSFTTDCYKLHYLDSPSGIKIVLNTSTDVGNLEKALWTIYSSLYCEYMVKNPLWKHNTISNNELFVEKLNTFVSNI